MSFLIDHLYELDLYFRQPLLTLINQNNLIDSIELQILDSHISLLTVTYFKICTYGLVI